MSITRAAAERTPATERESERESEPVGPRKTPLRGESTTAREWDWTAPQKTVARAD